MDQKSTSKSAFQRISGAARHPIQSFKKLSNNGRLAVFLGTLLVITGVFSLIFVLNTSDDNREDTVSNNFETQVSTLTPLNATVAAVEGNVMYKTSGGDWEKATVETSIQTEDEVKTEGAASRTIIRFDNGSEVRLDGDSYVRVDATTKEKIEIYLVKGKTYSRVSENSIPYSVESENAHYEALGTVFVAESSGDKQAVEVIESSIIETTTNNTIDEGNRYIVKSAVNPSDDKKIEQIDINTYKNDPFIEWNLAIDEANEAYRNRLGFLEDTDAPDITIDSPKQDEVILTESSSDTGSVVIQGRANGAVQVRIIAKSINGSPVTEVDVASDGTFKAPPIDSPLGLSVFSIEAKDRSGNIGTESLRVTIQQKSAPAEESGDPIVLLKSATTKNNKITLSWYVSDGIDDSRLRVLYSKSDNPTLTSNNGVWTPTKGSNLPATITNSFDTGGLDKETYYFRMCELNETDNDCKLYSNTLSANIE